MTTELKVKEINPEEWSEYVQSLHGGMVEVMCSPLVNVTIEYADENGYVVEQFHNVPVTFSDEP